MRRHSLAILLLAACAMTSTSAQRPSDPALMLPQVAPVLDYVPVANFATLPDGVTMGPPASVAIDARGHLIVLARGATAFFEFDDSGRFIRAFGDNLFRRAHGLRIDGDGNYWTTDVSAHTVMKFNPAGDLLLTLGKAGQAGEWNEATGVRRLNQPNDVAISRIGEVFVAQGHTPGSGGDARVLKFDRTGKYLAQWGGKGTEPGKFQVAHGITIDARNQVWVTDRENQRIQLFETDGRFIREIKYSGLPCSLDIGPDAIYMVNGFAAQLVKLSLDGTVVAALGKAGRGPGEFGEAHMVAVSRTGDVYVADSVNGTLQKFVKAGTP